MLSRLLPSGWGLLGARTAVQGLHSVSLAQGASVFGLGNSLISTSAPASSSEDGAVKNDVADASASTAAESSDAPKAPQVDRAKERAELEAQGRKKLYFGNLPWSMQTDDLTQILRDKFGATVAVHDAIVMIDKKTSLSRGYGFVTLDIATAEQAVAELNNIDVQGRQIRIAEVMESSEHKPHRPRASSTYPRSRSHGGAQRPSPMRGSEYGQ